MKKSLVMMGILCVVLATGYSELNAADFGKALAISQTNIAPGPDAGAMGNCWAANPNFSSNNPAVIAAGSDPFKVAGSYNFNWIKFSHGPSLNLHITSLAATLPRGVLQVNAANANSGTAGTTMEVDTKFAYSSYVELMYGLQVAENLFRSGDKFFMGAGGLITASRINFSQLEQGIFVSHSRGFELKTGILYQPVKGLNFGAMYAYSRDRNNDREISQNDDGSISWNSKRSTSDLHQLRLGASWQILPRLLLAADYQHLNVGHVKRDQYFVGAEYQVMKEIVSLYAGCANGGPTVGIGIYPSKNFGLNVAYQHNAFSDLNEHLGRSQMLSAMAFFNF